jgi:hypothetical protein
VKKSVAFELEELTDLQTAVIRMLWTWQARKEAKHPESDRYLERYQRLYLKISNARWSEDSQPNRPPVA